MDAETSTAPSPWGAPSLPPVGVGMMEEEEEESRRERLHFRVCRFILESGVKLGLGSLPLASACTIYHRFVARTAPGAYDPYLVATAAIFLAGKVEEQHLRARDILNVCHRYLYPRLPPLQVDNTFWDLRESLVQCELLMLRVLNFQVSFQHPHKYLLHYLLALRGWLNRHVWQRTPLGPTAWALLRDSYHGPLCLRHRPQHLAAAALHLALLCYGLEVPGQGGSGRDWWQVLCEGCTWDILQEIGREMVAVYEMDAKL